jgi:hypothetical protein
MAKKSKTSEERLRERWLDAYEALTDLMDFHVWPIGKDIAKLEDELLRELDTVERQFSQDHCDHA